MKFILACVQEAHDTPGLGNSEYCQISVASHGEIGFAHVDKVCIPDAFCVRGAGFWQVVAFGLAIHALMAGFACVRDGGWDANAVAAQLGNLGNMSMTKAQVPQLIR